MYPNPSAIVGGGSYRPEARALFARMSPAPSTARKRTINATIDQLLRQGLWAKLDALYLLAADASANALRNWVSSSYTATNSGAAFTADRGFTGNGTTAYINTNYAPSAGPTFLQNSHAYGRWVRTATGGNQTTLCVSTGGSSYHVIRDNPSGVSLTTADGPFTAKSFGVSPSGDVCVSRTASGTYNVYQTGAALGSDSQGSVPLATDTFFLLAENSSGVPSGYSSSQVSAAYMGGGLTAGEVSTLHGILQSYMTDVGA